MILKTRDNTKENEIKQLKQLLSASNSESQKKLIAAEISKLESGIKGEESAAYFLDFNLRDSENYVVLHDMRFEIDGQVAQIDHMLVSAVFGIILIETKNTNAKSVYINEDGSMLYKYANGKQYNQPDPLEQSRRHEMILKKVLDSINFNEKIQFESVCVFMPEVVIENTKLPSNFYRADSFIEKYRNEAIFSIKLFKTITNKFRTPSEIELLARRLKDLHKPHQIDYSTKFKIATPKETKKPKEKEVKTTTTDNSSDINILQICKQNNIDVSSFCDIQYAGSYMGHPMVSFTCTKCKHTQKKGLKAFTTKQTNCTHCQGDK